VQLLHQQMAETNVISTWSPIGGELTRFPVASSFGVESSHSNDSGIMMDCMESLPSELEPVVSAN
jgi:hypothetical protein